MNATDTEISVYIDGEEQDVEGRESGLLLRTFEARPTPGEGRTIDVRIVPYGERITHNDGLGGLPKGVPYQEEWVQGAFAGQERAANRVLVNFEHQEGLAGVVGHGVALLERSDGLYGSFKLHETPDGDKALMLVQEGVLEGISLEARGRKSVRTRDGVIQRVKAHLRNIALCRSGAYSGAVVLALREEAQIIEEPIDENLLPISTDPELIERCRRLGIRLPQRYEEAHPDDADTPAEAGTSEHGTRPNQETLTSEE